MLILAAAFGCFYAGMYLYYDRHDPPGAILIWVSVALLLGGGSIAATRRLRDIGVHAVAGIATMLPRIGWLTAIVKFNLWINDGWVEFGFAMLALDTLVLLVLSLWPGQRTANAHGPSPPTLFWANKT